MASYSTYNILPIHIRIMGDRKLARLAKGSGPEAAPAAIELASRKAYRATLAK
jgi:hypothetical protein